MTLSEQGPALDPMQATLERLYAEARWDFKYMIPLVPRLLRSLITGESLMQLVPPSRMRHAYIPISREEGDFLYATARSVAPRKVVEFGTAFGISTIRLASAVRDAGGGMVLSCEIEPQKCREARANLDAAGLAAYATVLEGDARHTLANVEGPIELVFLDGWKDLYLPILELLEPRLAPRAIVLADNIRFRDARPYLDRVRAPGAGFVSCSLFGGRMEYSCYVGGADRGKASADLH